ncbi:MAG: hypothetical protein K9N23_23420 [Akkermansiaceae bacterium]|nr:hypothetical protein [Akkermansiaceae bacterium]
MQKSLLNDPEAQALFMSISPARMKAEGITAAEAAFACADGLAYQKRLETQAADRKAKIAGLKSKLADVLRKTAEIKSQTAVLRARRAAKLATVQAKSPPNPQLPHLERLLTEPKPTAPRSQPQPATAAPEDRPYATANIASLLTFRSDPVVAAELQARGWSASPNGKAWSKSH